MMDAEASFGGAHAMVVCLYSWRRLGWAMAKVENGTLKNLRYEDMVVGFALYVNPSTKMTYKRTDA